MKYAAWSELLRKAFSSISGLFPTKYERMSACGKSLGRCSWNSVSQAMITVTGAAMVLSTLPGARTGLSIALAPGVVRKTNLAGEPFALVGPRRANSYGLRRALATKIISTSTLTRQPLALVGQRRVNS